MLRVVFYLLGELWLQNVEWLKSITSLPILLKGITTAEDGNIMNKLTTYCHNYS
jgi:hypothetical protein